MSKPEEDTKPKVNAVAQSCNIFQDMDLRRGMALVKTVNTVLM